MFTLGIVLLTLGCIIKICMKLSTREETKALSPQPVGQRSSAIEMMRLRKRSGIIDANLLIILGALLTLVTAVFN